MTACTGQTDRGRETKPNFAARLLPSLGDVAFLFPLVLLFGRLSGTKMLLGDGDTGWHVRTGEWMLANGSIPRQDLFSFTKPGQPWYAWEWLWDLTFGWLHLHWGMAAVLIASIAVICATSALLFSLVQRRCSNRVVAVAVTSLAVAVSSMHWLARPHLFTLLFTVAFCVLIERSRLRPRVLWALVPLTALWTNLHGGFLAGILVILAYAAGDLAAGLFDARKDARQAAFARGGTYLLWAAGCSVATLANPYGYHLHVHIWRYLTDPFLYDHIGEYLPATFRDPDWLFRELIFLLAAITIYKSIRRRNFGDAFLLSGWGHLALMSQRNMPILALMTAPMAAGLVQEWLDALGTCPAARWVRRTAEGVAKAAAEFDLMDRAPRFHLVSVAGLAVVAVLLYAPSAPEVFRCEYDRKRYPAAALPYLMQTGVIKTTFADDEWGDYLIYKLYPAGGKVFVDGRSDFYGGKFDEAYLDVLDVKHGWERTLGRYGVDTVLLHVDAPLAGALKESARWRVAYDDGSAIVFRSAPGITAAERNSIANSGTNRDREVAQPKVVTQLSYPNGGKQNVE